MNPLLQLPSLLGAALAVVGTVALAVIPLVAVHRLLRPDVSDATVQLADRVARLVGALHALILALVFADAQATYTEVRRAMILEAEEVTDVYLNLASFDDPRSAELGALLLEYARVVAEEEWPLLANLEQSPRAGRLFDLVNLGVMDLAADSHREEVMQAQMIEDLDAIADHNHSRLFLGRHSLPPLFWYLALAGFVLVVATFFVFRATAANVLLLGAYAAYTGLVLYFILALTHPFAGPAALDPTPFRLVAERAAGATSHTP